MKKILIMCLMAFISVSIYAEKQTVTLYVKDMECHKCQAKVDKVLAFEKGVKKLDYNLNTRTVVIVYEDTRTSVEKLQGALVKYLKFNTEVFNPQVHCKKTCCSAANKCVSK